MVCCELSTGCKWAKDLDRVEAGSPTCTATTSVMQCKLITRLLSLVGAKSFEAPVDLVEVLGVQAPPPTFFQYLYAVLPVHNLELPVKTQ